MALRERQLSPLARRRLLLCLGDLVELVCSRPEVGSPPTGETNLNFAGARIRVSRVCQLSFGGFVVSGIRCRCCR